MIIGYFIAICKSKRTIHLHGEGWSKSEDFVTQRKRLKDIRVLPDFHLYCGKVFFELYENFLLFICVSSVSCPLLRVYDCEVDSECCKRVCI